MASVQAFTSVLDEFLNELKETFPKEKKIKVYYNSFTTMKKTNGRKVLELFMEAATPKAQMITSKNEELFSDDTLFPDIELSKLWKSIDTETKDTIWQYLNTLYVLGSTITSLPKELMQTIESVAENCAANMNMDEGGMPDMGSLFAGVQNMMTQMQNQTKPAKIESKESKESKE